MESSGSRLDHVNPDEPLPSEKKFAMVIPGGPFDRDQKQSHQTPPSLESHPSRMSLTQQSSSLPYPLNLPPSYPVYPSLHCVVASSRHQYLPGSRQSASLLVSQPSTKSPDVFEGNSRVRNALGASSPNGKAKGTTAGCRRASTNNEPESSGSDSDISQKKILALSPSNDCPLSDSAPPSSSPPSSSPLKTPKGSSPFGSAYAHASLSPTPKRPPQPKSSLPFVLPLSPYLLQKPHWSLSALIGQALNASRSGSLILNDIYSYISTVYPYYDRTDQSWMSSIRHNLSVQDAFERIPDGGLREDKNGKGKSRRRNGSWRIKPGYEVCFTGGNFVKIGAKGAGPGLNQRRKRSSEDSVEHKDKRLKTEAPTLRRSSTRSRKRSRACSPAQTTSPNLLPCKQSSLPSLTASQSTVSSEALPDPSEFHPSSPFGHNNDVTIGSLLCPSPLHSGVSAQEAHNIEINRDLFARVLASTSSAHASSSRPLGSSNVPHQPFPPQSTSRSAYSSFSRATTPPPSHCPIPPTFSLTRTPMPHNGVHMNPSQSLAHYKSSLDPEWQSKTGSTHLESCVTPPRRDSEPDNERTLTPRRLIFPPCPPQASPFRTPGRATNRRGYDPYDPETLLADELASIRNANDPQESPGGFFGKEGRRLLYESPSVPCRSHWRLRDDV